MFIIVCIALAASGLGLIVYGVRRFLRERQLAASASNWASAEGEIVSASLDIKESMNADQERLVIYRPVVSYRYPASGGEHTGSRVWLNRDTFHNEADARQWLAAHPAGGPITVHYDAEQPGMAALVLDKPSVVVAIVTAGFGVILAWTGLSLLMES